MVTMTDTGARAWIGSLAAYNAGRLVGAWIDLDGMDAEEAAEAAREAMRPQIAGWMDEAQAFDELNVFDHEGLAPFVRGECNVSEAVAAAEKLAEVEEHERDAFLAWAANEGNPATVEVEDFRDAFMGEWDSLEDYARELLDESGALNAIPENLRAYFDFESYARDLRLSGDVFTVPNGAGGVFVFNG